MQCSKVAFTAHCDFWRWTLLLQHTPSAHITPLCCNGLFVRLRLATFVESNVAGRRATESTPVSWLSGVYVVCECVACVRVAYSFVSRLALWKIARNSPMTVSRALLKTELKVIARKIRARARVSRLSRSFAWCALYRQKHIASPLIQHRSVKCIVTRLYPCPRCILKAH